MLHWLRQAAGELRASTGRTPTHVGAGASVDTTTIRAFENGRTRGYPRALDDIIAAYAVDIDGGSFAIWARALELWREHRDQAGP